MQLTRLAKCGPQELSHDFDLADGRQELKHITWTRECIGDLGRRVRPVVSEVIAMTERCWECCCYREAERVH